MTLAGTISNSTTFVLDLTPNTPFSGVVASFTDSDLVGLAGDFTVSIDWGDGSTATPGTVTGSNGVFSVSGSHSYAAGGRYSVAVTLSDDGSGTAKAVASSTALVVSPSALDLVDPSLASAASVIEPLIEGLIAPLRAQIAQLGSASSIAASEGVALTNTPVAAFIDTSAADKATDFVALIDWGDGTTSFGMVNLVGALDVNAGPLPVHAAAFEVTGSHTYADESEHVPLRVSIIRTTDNVSGVLTQSATFDFAHPAVVASVTVADADVLTPLPLPALAADPRVFNGTVAAFADSNSNGAANDFAATIDWGDGTTSVEQVSDVNGTITVPGLHAYANAGRYRVTVSLVDDGGVSATVQRDALRAIIPGSCKAWAPRRGLGAASSLCASQFVSKLPGSQDSNFDVLNRTCAASSGRLRQVLAHV
jgi:hypothetical protein